MSHDASSSSLAQDANIILEGPISVRNSRGRWRDGVGVLISGKFFIFKVRPFDQLILLICMIERERERDGGGRSGGRSGMRVGAGIVKDGG